MNDKMKSDDSGEDELDYLENQEVQEPPILTRTDHTQNAKRILIVVSVISVVGFLGYKFFTRPKTAAVAQQPPSTLIAKAAPAVPPPAPAAPANPEENEASFAAISKAFSESDQTTMPAPNPPPQAAQVVVPSPMPMPVPENGTLDSLQQLSQLIEQNSQQIRALESALMNMNRSLNNLNSDLSSMDSRILALTNSTHALSNDVSNMKKLLSDEGVDADHSTPAQVSKETPVSPMYETPDYSVHAAIPGRAWLKNRKGQIITVTEGDSLGNYGKILVIDATSGVVLTSSGIAFR